MKIFNLVCNIVIIAYWVYKNNRFYISPNKTFWCKKIKGYHLMYITHEGHGWREAKGVLYLPLRNSKKYDKWDSEQFTNGRYKKYRKENETTKTK